jgi:hypothetical protein
MDVHSGSVFLWWSELWRWWERVGAESLYGDSAPRARACVTFPQKREPRQMTRPLNATGVIYKLESTEGTLLGIVMIPSRWEDHIRYYGHVDLHMVPQQSARAGDINDRADQRESIPLLRCATLALSNGNYPDALVMFGITPEEFETLPGCAFIPGAAYLRSVAA